MKLFRNLSIIFVSLAPFISAAQITYQALAPLPNVNTGGAINAGYLSLYLNNLYLLGVGLCTALAVLMIIIGGVQWASSDAWSKKSEGKERIWSAVLGLLIALGSWVILNTINPDLLNTELDFGDSVSNAPISTTPNQPGSPSTPTNPPQPTNPTQPTKPNPTNPTQPTQPTPGAPTSPTTPTTPTGNKAQIPTGIAIKEGAGDQIDSSMVAGLQGMSSQLSASGVNWRVTEAWPPTRTHRSPCHQAGTCIDANFTGNTSPTASNVNSFVNAARSSGFRAVYEVQTESQKNDLVAGGVPAGNIAVLGSWISAPHFSVYNN